MTLRAICQIILCYFHAICSFCIWKSKKSHFIQNKSTYKYNSTPQSLAYKYSWPLIFNGFVSFGLIVVRIEIQKLMFMTKIVKWPIMFGRGISAACAAWKGRFHGNRRWWILFFLLIIFYKYIEFSHFFIHTSSYNWQFHSHIFISLDFYL